MQPICIQKKRSRGVIPDNVSKDGNSLQLWTPVESVAQDIHKFSYIVDVVITLPSTVDTRQNLFGRATPTMTQPQKPRKTANASTIVSIASYFLQIALSNYPRIICRMHNVCQNVNAPPTPTPLFSFRVTMRTTTIDTTGDNQKKTSDHNTVTN